jgi:hypothetical protein
MWSTPTPARLWAAARASLLAVLLERHFHGIPAPELGYAGRQVSVIPLSASQRFKS